MKLIVGLGNPGKEYENTRHNVGFLVVDALQVALEAGRIEPASLGAGRGRVEPASLGAGRGRPTPSDVQFLKPDTFMNLSGQAVVAALRQTNMTAADIIVVYDDADLPLGEIRVRTEGSSGGHNGMQSIIDHLGTDQITRVRVGIGRPENPNVPLEDWVLGKWSSEESEKLKEIIEKTAELISQRL